MRFLHRAAFAAALSFWFSGCAKISDFTEPEMIEIYACQNWLVPVLRGVVTMVIPPGLVIFNGSSDGRSVTIGGIPKGDAFELVPKEFLKPGVFPPTISGLHAEVVDRDTLRVTGVASRGGAADEWDLEVRGTITKGGPILATLRDDPIVISVSAKNLRSVLHPAAAAQIRRISDGVGFMEIPDSEMIDLYQIKTRCTIQSVF